MSPASSRHLPVCALALLLPACGLFNDPPVTSITEPGDFALFYVDDSICFSASATDEEDGALSGDAVIWTSSMDGRIGTGASFCTTTLREGKHTIQVTATDSGGDSASSQRQITVEASGARVAAYNNLECGGDSTTLKVEIAGKTLTSTTGNYSEVIRLKAGAYEIDATLTSSDCGNYTFAGEVEINDEEACYVISDKVDDDDIYLTFGETTSCDYE